MGKKSRKKGAKKSKKSAVSSAPPHQQQQQQPPSHRDETTTTTTINKREFFVGDRVWFLDSTVDMYDPNTFRGYIGKIDGSSSTIGIITFHSLMEGREDEMVWGELIVFVQLQHAWYSF